MSLQGTARAHRLPLPAIAHLTAGSWHLRQHLLFLSLPQRRPFKSRGREKKRMATSNLNLRPSQLSHSVPTLDPSFRVSQSFMSDAWHVPLLPPTQGDWSITFRSGDQGRRPGRGGPEWLAGGAKRGSEGFHKRTRIQYRNGACEPNLPAWPGLPVHTNHNHGRPNNPGPSLPPRSHSPTLLQI